MTAAAPLSDGAPLPPAGKWFRPALLRDMAVSMVALWPWLAALAAVVAAHAAAVPSFGWMGKRLLDGLQASNSDLHRVLLENGLVFGALALLVTAIKALEKIGSKTMEIKLVIHLQRVFVDRRAAPAGARDVSHMLYGTEVARKGFEVLYKDSAVVVFKTLSVTVWQWTLAPEWLPLLFLAVVPAGVTVALVGPAIQRASREILSLQETVAASTTRRQVLFLRRAQNRLFARAVRFEALKVGAEEAMSVLIWFNAIVLVGASYLLGLGLLPDRVDPGVLALVAVNLKLLSEPIGHLGKVYTKWQEALPALDRIFQSQARGAA